MPEPIFTRLGMCCIMSSEPISTLYFINTPISNTNTAASQMLLLYWLNYGYICLSMALQPFVGLGRFYSFLMFYTVGMTPWMGDQPVARPLPAHRTAQTQNKRTQTSIPQVGFEPTIPVFERAKTARSLWLALRMHTTHFFLLLISDTQITVKGK
jgi:hypothetical protein